MGGEGKQVKRMKEGRGDGRWTTNNLTSRTHLDHVATLFRFHVVDKFSILAMSGLSQVEHECTSSEPSIYSNRPCGTHKAELQTM